MLTSKKYVKNTNAIFAITPFDGKCQNLQMSPKYFWFSSYYFRDITISNFYLKKVDHGHRVQFSQLDHSKINVKIYKSLSHIFALAVTVTDIYIFYFYFKK